MSKTGKTSLVFLHGFRGTPEGIEAVASCFSEKEYNIYTPALPPFGGAGNLDEYTADSYAKYIADFVKTQKIKKPILVGHSMGSIVATATAAKYPELLGDKLILLAPITEKPRKFIANLQPLVSILPNRLMGWMTTRYLFMPHDKKLYRDTLETVCRCGADFTSRNEVRKAAAFSANNCIQDFDWKQRTLMIVGETDRVVYTDKTLAFAKQKHADIEVIKNAGHLINYETPAEIARIIKAWL